MDLVEVSWSDSKTFFGWMPLEETLAVCPAKSVGYLLKKDKNIIVLGQTVDMSDSSFNGAIVIPTGVVTHIEVLRRKK